MILIDIDTKMADHSLFFPSNYLFFPVLFFMLRSSYYSQNYASIIRQGLLLEHVGGLEAGCWSMQEGWRLAAGACGRAGGWLLEHAGACRRAGDWLLEHAGACRRA